MGRLKPEGLYDGLSVGTQAHYMRGWRHRRRFCETRKSTPRVDANKEDLDVDLLDFIMYEPRVLNIPPLQKEETYRNSPRANNQRVVGFQS